MKGNSEVPPLAWSDDSVCRKTMHTSFSESSWRVLSNSFPWLNHLSGLFIKKMLCWAQNSNFFGFLVNKCFSTKAALSFWTLLLLLLLFCFATGWSRKVILALQACLALPFHCWLWTLLKCIVLSTLQFFLGLDLFSDLKYFHMEKRKSYISWARLKIKVTTTPLRERWGAMSSERQFTEKFALFLLKCSELWMNFEILLRPLFSFVKICWSS